MRRDWDEVESQLAATADQIESSLDWSDPAAAAAVLTDFTKESFDLVRRRLERIVSGLRSE